MSDSAASKALVLDHQKFVELLQILRDAQERLAVHALSDVGKYIDWAIKILEG